MYKDFYSINYFLDKNQFSIQENIQESMQFLIQPVYVCLCHQVYKVKLVQFMYLGLY